MRTCVIFCAAGFDSLAETIGNEDLVIAADGGWKHTQRLGIKPDILLGDFDSLGEPPALPAGVELLRHPVRKNDTDTVLALNVGWERGYRDFALYGCGGGRIDHLLANFQSMGRYAGMGAQVRLIDPGYTAYALANGRLVLPPAKAGTLVSVFCHGQTARGVTLQGLSYPLEDAVLTCDYPLGVSNAYEDPQPMIEVKDGTLLVVAGCADR